MELINKTIFEEIQKSDNLIKEHFNQVANELINKQFNEFKESMQYINDELDTINTFL